MLIKMIVSILVIISYGSPTYSATIGDGSTSLYTGSQIWANDTRGSCYADGNHYYSETALPRQHPCHYCICYQSKINCYWKDCPAPPPGCRIMKIQKTCNPSLYVCEIPQNLIFESQFSSSKLSLSDINSRKRIFRRRRSNAADETQPTRKISKRSADYFKIKDDNINFEEAWKLLRTKLRRKRAILPHRPSQQNLLRRNSCTVLGVTYQLGEVMGVASDVCMECRCANKFMFCSPKCCFSPAPLSITGKSKFLSPRLQSRSALSFRHPLYYLQNQIRT